MFFLPNILICSFIKKENMNLIHEISNIVQSLELSLSANIPIYKSLAISANVIKYKRFKNSYIKFIEDYKMYNLNMERCLEGFRKKFNSYEFNMFLAMLSDIEKEGYIEEGLKVFEKTLESLYFKYLRYQASKNFLFISMTTVISLVNIFILVGYPIFMQISDGLQNFFI